MGKKDLMILLAALAAAFAMVLAQFGGNALETGAWGLHFDTEGQQPSGPAGEAELRKLDAVYVGSEKEKVIYLTFDAGYENGSTAKILDVLKQYQVPAAFFLVGNYMEKNPDLVRRMVEEGHIVGNHTMHHKDMRTITDPEKFARELSDLEALFTQITGKTMPKYYRPPQGTYSRENLALAQKLGYRTVFWSLAYADWDNSNQPTREYAMGKLLPRMHNGAVVLLHSTSQTNGEILEALLQTWQQQGYRFAPISELFPQDA